jgi:hypothetical protein
LRHQGKELLISIEEAFTPHDQWQWAGCHTKSGDGQIDLTLDRPVEMGKRGMAPPEQLLVRLLYFQSRQVNDDLVARSNLRRKE